MEGHSQKSPEWVSQPLYVRDEAGTPVTWARESSITNLQASLGGLWAPSVCDPPLPSHTSPGPTFQNAGSHLLSDHRASGSQLGSSESGCAWWALETWPVWWHLGLHPGPTYLNEMLHTSLSEICLFLL